MPLLQELVSKIQKSRGKKYGMLKTILNKNKLEDITKMDSKTEFRRNIPFHPDIIDTLIIHLRA